MKLARRLPTLLALLALHAAPGAPAAPAPDPCATQANTLEINECGQQTLKLKDAALNRAYQDLLKSLSPESQGDSTDYAAVRKELAEAQRAWIRYRDADCSAKYKFWEQGSIRGAMYLGCMTERTEQRTRELRQWSGM